MRRALRDKLPGRKRRSFRLDWKEGTRRRILLALLTSGCLFLATWARILPQRLDLVEGDMAPRTIRAPRAGVYVDDTETARLREEAAASVPDVYAPDSNATNDALATLDDIFARIAQARADRTLVDSLARVHALRNSLVTALTTETMELAVSPSTTDNALRRVKEATAGLVRRQMSREIRNNTDDLQQARARLAEDARGIGLSSTYTTMVADLGQAVLKANRIVDEDKTLKAKQEKRDAVKEVKHPVQPGDVIIAAREEVRPHHIAAFRAVGLMQAQVDYSQAAGVLVAYTLMVVLLGLFAMWFAEEAYRDFGQLLAVAGLLVLVAVAYHTIEPTSWFEPGALTAAVTATMLVSLLVHQLLALATGVTIGLMLPMVTAGSDARLATVIVLSCTCAAFLVARRGSISSVVAVASPAMALAGTAIMGAGGQVFGIDLGTRTLVITAIGGLASPMLAMGASVALERLFGFTTDFRLTELNNPHEPLLRKLLAEAPGSYQSSIMVGNLAEPAAEEIAADALLVRTGALYHDIGKIRRPFFFVENQFGGDNPHDRLSPHLSALVLIAHVKDGLDMADEYRLPDAIKRCIAEHQGTSLIKFFYQRAVETADDPHDIQESNFRYPGPKPSTRETALLMLADTVEAAARTLEHPSHQEISQLVQRLIDDKVRDGQLDDSPLSFHDLAVIRRSFVNTLAGMFHQRIKYPEQIADEVRKAARTQGKKPPAVDRVLPPPQEKKPLDLYDEGDDADL